LDFSCIDCPTRYSFGEACIVVGIALVFGVAAVVLLRSAQRDEGENAYSIKRTPSGFRPWRRGVKSMLASACVAAGGMLVSFLVYDGVNFY
jgi:ABC-type Fe3+ transport system permease subunit